MGDQFYVAIFGSDHGAKCEVANTLLKNQVYKPNKKILGIFMKSVAEITDNFQWTLSLTVSPDIQIESIANRMKGHLNAKQNVITLFVNTDKTKNSDSEVKKWIDEELNGNTRLEFLYKHEEFQRNKEDIRKDIVERIRKVMVPDRRKKKPQIVEVAPSKPTEEKRAPPLSSDLTETERKLYRDTLRYGSAPSNCVPVIVVGHEKAGKTMLIKKLLNLDDSSQDISDSCTATCVIDKDTNTLNYVKDDHIDELNKQRMAMAMDNVQKEQMKNLNKCNSEGTAMIRGRDETTVDSGCIDEFKRDKYLRDIVAQINQSKEPKTFITVRKYSGYDTHILSHSAFLPPNAIYLMVVDISLDLEKKKLSASMGEKHVTSKCLLREYTVLETIIFWASSIRTYTRNCENGQTAPIRVVAIRKDNTVLKANTELKRKRIEEELFRNNLTDIKVELLDTMHDHENLLKTLRSHIIDTSLNYSTQTIPAQWIEIEHELVLLKGTQTVTTVDEIKSIASNSDVPLKDENELIRCLEFQHHSGNLIFIPNIHENNPVILNTGVLLACMHALEKKGSIDKANRILTSVQEELNLTCDDICIIFFIMQYFNFILPMSDEVEEQYYRLPCCFGRTFDDRKEDLKENAPVIQILFKEIHTHPTYYYIFLQAFLPKFKCRKRPYLSYMYTQIYIDGYSVYLEIRWTGQAINIHLKNLSNRIKLKDTDCPSFLRRIKTAVELSLKGSCLINVECNQHGGCFVNLETLEADGEAQCKTLEHVHFVQRSVLGVYNSEPIRSTSPIPKADDKRSMDKTSKDERTKDGSRENDEYQRIKYQRTKNLVALRGIYLEKVF